MVATLYLRIHAKRSALYWVTPLEVDGMTAWRLSTSAGKSYDVTFTRQGAECECEDFLFRRANTGQACKHISSLRSVGLLPKEEPQR